MKKINYIKPMTEVVRLEAEGLLQDLSDADSKSNVTFGAPSRMSLDEDDELDSYGSIDETYKRRKSKYNLW